MKKIFYLITSLGISTCIRAQSDSTKSGQLNEVVVTATKSGMKESQTGKIVTVLDQKIIDNNPGRTLSELLNTQAGVFLSGANNTLGTNIDSYFRGADAGNLLIVIDGVPVYDPSQPNNVFDLNSIPLEQIERIEILKGGQSTLWGSDAVAGVIQIFLKKEHKKKVEANGSFSYGSYNTLRTGAGLNGTIDKLGYLVQYNYTKSAGISAAYDSLGNQNFDKDFYRQNNLEAELHYALSKRLSIKAFGNFSTYHNGLDEGAFTDDKDYTAKNKNNIGAFMMNYHHKEFSWNALVSYQQARRSFVNDSSDISSLYSKYYSGIYAGNTFTVETFGNIRLERHMQLVLGAQYIHQNTDEHYISISDFGDYFSNLNKDSAKSKQYSLYGSFLITELNGFNFEIGGRLNNHSIYGNNGTFTINPSFNVNVHLKLFLNISSGYKIPTLYQLYSEYGNMALKPESSITYELGGQSDLINQKLSLRLAFFKRDAKNLIIFYTDPNTFASQYINRDKQNDYGFEIEQNLRLGNAGSWTNNLAYVEGKGIQDGVKTSNLFRRPNFTWSSILTMQPVNHLTVSPSFRIVGKRLKGPFDIGPDNMPSYYAVDCLISYALTHGRVFAEFHNITNQQYFDIVGYNSKRFNMMAGVNFNF